MGTSSVDCEEQSFRSPSMGVGTVGASFFNLSTILNPACSTEQSQLFAPRLFSAPQH